MKDIRQEHEGIVDMKYYYLKNTFISLLVKHGLLVTLLDKGGNLPPVIPRYLRKIGSRTY